MNIEALKQQLAEGKITQEQFTAELKTLLDAGTITQEQHDSALNANNSSNNNQGGNNGGLSKEDIEKMLQSATDKIRTEYAQKLKAAGEELDKLKTEKMSAEEKAKYELEKLIEENKRKSAEIQSREVALHTVDKLRELELPLSFRDILAGKDVEETNKRIDGFRGEWQKALQEAVDAKFKGAGGDPNKGKDGNNGGGSANPWAKETFNLTRQAQMMQSNPEQARSMAAAVGVTLNF